jgi:hypothetical protein
MTRGSSARQKDEQKATPYALTVAAICRPKERKQGLILVDGQELALRQRKVLGRKRKGENDHNSQEFVSLQLPAAAAVP